MIHPVMTKQISDLLSTAMQALDDAWEAVDGVDGLETYQRAEISAAIEVAQEETETAKRTLALLTEKD